MKQKTGERFRGTLEHVPSGQRRVEVQLEDYAGWNGSTLVEDQETSEVEVALAATFGALQVRSSPANAVVRLGDREVGRTPVTWRGKRGTYRLTVEGPAPDYAPVSTDVSLVPGQITPLNYDLRRLVGKLQVATQPTGARIRLDGKDQGDAPRVLTDVGVGSHEVQATLEGYESAAARVEVQEGKTAVASLTLEQTVQRAPQMRVHYAQMIKQYGLINYFPSFSKEFKTWLDVEWPDLVVSFNAAGVAPRYNSIRFRHPNGEINLREGPIVASGASSEWWALPFFGLSGDFSVGNAVVGLDTRGLTNLNNKSPWSINGGFGIIARPPSTGPAARISIFANYSLHWYSLEGKETASIKYGDVSCGIALRPLSFLHLEAEYTYLSGSISVSQTDMADVVNAISIHTWLVRAKIVLFDFIVSRKGRAAVITNGWYSRGLLDSDRGNYGGGYLKWGVSASFAFLFDLD